ncbi:MAG: transcription initiation factor TFIIIB [Clostridium saudiense]|jgi:hypothetical protein|nr:transcription initiation factor TFIIIB [Peptostreptococcaceae bacterium]MEE0727416.1 transcription initiation factor TFIIIB [Clostridium saudiense]
MEQTKCKKCGSSNIGQGTLDGYAAMQSKNTLLGSGIIADICTDCGEILSMRVKEPKKFKNKK